MTSINKFYNEYEYLNSLFWYDMSWLSVLYKEDFQIGVSDYYIDITMDWELNILFKVNINDLKDYLFYSKLSLFDILKVSNEIYYINYNNDKVVNISFNFLDISCIPDKDTYHKFYYESDSAGQIWHHKIKELYGS